MSEAIGRILEDEARWRKRVENLLQRIFDELNHRHDQPATNHSDFDRELLTVAEFAARVHLKPQAIYKRLRLDQSPSECLVRVLDRQMIDWTRFKQSIVPRKVGNNARNRQGLKSP